MDHDGNRHEDRQAELICATERERLRALVEADVEGASRQHADDYQLINPLGGALSKADYLEAIASGAIDYQVFEPDSEIAVRLYGGAAAVRYQARIEIAFGGRLHVLRAWHTDLYEQRGGRWQVVWSQATEIR
jgi:hypothetical protein